MGEVAKFLGRKSGHVLRNAIAAANVAFVSNTDASTITTLATLANNFGGVGVTALLNNGVHLTWLNNSTPATPAFAVMPYGVTSHGGAGDHRFMRIAGTSVSSCIAAMFGGAATAAGTFDFGVFGVVRGDASTA